MKLELVGKLVFYSAMLLSLVIIGLAAAIEWHWLSLDIEAPSMAFAGAKDATALLPIALALERLGRA